MICTIKRPRWLLNIISDQIVSFFAALASTQKNVLKLNQMDFIFFIFDLIVWMYGMPEGDCLCLKEISIRSERGRKGERERWAYNQHVLVCLWVWRHSKKAPRNFSFADGLKKVEWEKVIATFPKLKRFFKGGPTPASFSFIFLFSYWKLF